MDLGGANLRVRAIGLKLTIPEFALGFDEGALLEGAGPFSELPPNHDPMPFGSRFIFAGVLLLPTHVGCEGKPSVAVPLGVKRVSASLPRNPMSVMRFLRNILCVLFVPLLLGRPRASGSCSQGQGTLCWGRPSGGTDKAESRRPAGRRALTPKQSPIEEARKVGHQTAREELAIRFQRLDKTEHTNVSAANREGLQRPSLTTDPRIPASGRM